MSREEDLYLGIDGGGSKTAFCLAEASGRVLVESSCGSIHLKQISAQEFRARVRTELHRLGLEFSRGRRLKRVFAGIPGYDEYPDLRAEADVLMAELFSCPKSCANDCVAGWAGGTACQPGINMVLGTGAIAYGRNAQGKDLRSSGWGPFVGDEGSAYDLGRKLLSIFGKEADGRLPRNAVYRLVREHFKLNTDFDIFIYLEKGAYERAFVAKLSMLLAEAAKAADPAAIQAFQKAGEEAALAILACARKLFTPDESVLVSTSGGVFKAGDLILNPLNAALKQSGWPFSLRPPRLEPLRGAVLMAMCEDGLEPDERRVALLARGAQIDLQSV
ncbi:MAG: ATPase [Clostridiales bacterium]|nr:ATPase [Clostridiales bacterium]MDD7432576.1 BadF/BadG/BcrA/BcrD ATPase family protein [Clostridiales bacterium]MDY3062153.1 BadF/BadG/BcrA/BcrD ATPase family protein [Eubacteriales bacterium]